MTLESGRCTRAQVGERRVGMRRLGESMDELNERLKTWRQV